MGKHRMDSGHPPKAVFPLRNKMVGMVIACGAFAAITQPLAANAGTAGEHDAPTPAAQQKYFPSAAIGTWNNPADVRLLSNVKHRDAHTEVSQLIKSEQLEAARNAQAEAARKAAEDAARQAAEDAWRREHGFVRPAEGRFTSGFGSRWGSTHEGADIANAIGTPIYAVAPGEVISAGPARGFGLWVRLRHEDGTITVYGHVNTITVRQGQHVNAGDQIATMGNRGESTGPHLHFGVQQNGTYIDPVPWLAQRGIDLS